MIDELDASWFGTSVHPHWDVRFQLANFIQSQDIKLKLAQLAQLCFYILELWRFSLIGTMELFSLNGA
jgi:hypothetical protein